MQGTTTYREEPYRFVIVIVYFAAAFVNSLPVHTFSSINVVVEEKFDITDTEVTLNALLFTISHPLFSVPCNWVINKYGMRVSFMVGTAFVVAGVWLRLLLEVRQSIFCLLGSGLASIGNIFVLNTPSKVALNWFRHEKVGIVTFTGILINLLSLTFGASVPSFIINK